MVDQVPAPPPATGALCERVGAGPDLSVQLKRAELRKLKLEIQDLRQKYHQDRWRHVFAVVGIAGFVVGFLLDRYKTWEQRDWEARVAANNRRIDRMVAVSAKLDDLYAGTLSTLRRNEMRVVLLGAALESIQDRLAALKGKSARRARPFPERRMSIQSGSTRERFKASGEHYPRGYRRPTSNTCSGRSNESERALK